MTTDNTPAETVEMRKGFEKWVQGIGWRTLDYNGESYSDGRMACYWSAWKAALASSSQPVIAPALVRLADGEIEKFPIWLNFVGLSKTTRIEIAREIESAFIAKQGVGT